MRHDKAGQLLALARLLASSAEGVTLDEMAEHWRIVKPNGKEVEIMPPVVDFSDRYVTWR